MFQCETDFGSENIQDIQRICSYVTKQLWKITLPHLRLLLQLIIWIILCISIAPRALPFCALVATVVQSFPAKHSKNWLSDKQEMFTKGILRVFFSSQNKHFTLWSENNTSKWRKIHLFSEAVGSNF